MRVNSPLFAAVGLLALGAIAALYAERQTLLAEAPALSRAAADSAHAPDETLESLREIPSFAAPTDSGISTAPIPKPVIVAVGGGLQCATYARMRSGLTISGNAGQWWYLAAGRYKRDRKPEPGAVMVLGGTRHGHVAVVVELRSKREVLVDHANWMNRGEIQMGALVRDVSPANDWTQVRVWYPPIDDLGNKAYPVYGFILNEPFQAALPAPQRYAAL
jgi:surface antigen